MSLEETLRPGVVGSDIDDLMGKSTDLVGGSVVLILEQIGEVTHGTATVRSVINAVAKIVVYTDEI